MGGDPGGAAAGRSVGSAGPAHVDDDGVGPGGEQVASAAAWAGRRCGVADDDDQRAAGRRPRRAEATAWSSPSAMRVAVVVGSSAAQRGGDAPRHGAGGDVGGAVELDDVGAGDAGGQGAVDAQRPRAPPRRRPRRAQRGGDACDRSGDRVRTPIRLGRTVGRRTGASSRRRRAATRAAASATRADGQLARRHRGHAPRRRTPRPAPRRCRGPGSTGRRRRPGPAPRGRDGRRARRRRPCPARRSPTSAAEPELAAQQVGHDAAADRGGTAASSAGTSRWPGITAGDPGGDGGPERHQLAVAQHVRVAATVGSARCESTAVGAVPGEVLGARRHARRLQARRRTRPCAGRRAPGRRRTTARR